MIDIHTHILPSIDDGSRSVDETFNLLKEAHEAGFTTIVSTSHYFLGHYEAEEKVRKSYIDAISEKLPEVIPNLQICVGSEIYVTNEIVSLIEEHKASTINSTNYVLFELPFEHQETNLKDIIYKLLGHNYIPIIAHPERYKYVQKDPNILQDLIEIGVLFQSNLASIIGWYGKETKKTVKQLLENNFIHFLASDVHRQETIYPQIPAILNELKEILSEEKIEELTTTNPSLMLSGEKIYIQKPVRIKKRLFNF